MRRVQLAFAVVAVALASAEKSKKPIEVDAGDVGTRIIIVGYLGLPVGAEVAVHGEKIRAGKGTQFSFLVDSVNGRLLKHPITIQIHRIVDWPIGTEAEIRGQEVGTLTFTDIGKTGFAENDPRFVLRQEVELSFYAAEVISPKSLKLKPYGQ